VPGCATKRTRGSNEIVLASCRVVESFRCETAAQFTRGRERRQTLMQPNSIEQFADRRPTKIPINNSSAGSWFGETRPVGDILSSFRGL